MSYQNYKEAMELAPKCKFYTTVGGRSEEEISKSEKLLGVKFSKQCRDFYEKYGYLSFFGNEISFSRETVCCPEHCQSIRSERTL